MRTRRFQSKDESLSRQEDQQKIVFCLPEGLTLQLSIQNFCRKIEDEMARAIRHL